MKKGMLVVTMVLVAPLIVASGQLLAGLRTVLIEEATNIGCGCAASLNPGLDSLLAYYGYVDLVAIRYHGWIPLEFDPFYLHNPNQVEDRYSYYGVARIPSLFIDGAAIQRSCTADAAKQKVKQGIQVESPIKLLVSESRSDDSCYLSIKILTEQNPQCDSLTLRVAVVEDSIAYQAPNGENLFNNVFRRFVGGSQGFVFEPVLGETLSFDLAFEIDQSWNPQKISSVVFVQNDNDKSIVQAASSRPRPAAWARYAAQRQGKVENLGSKVVFSGTLINRGASADTFDVIFSADLPLGWSASTDHIGGNPLPGGVEIEKDDSCAIFLTVECQGQPGTGYVRVEISSRSLPEFRRWLDFFVVAGTCGLLVDDDGGENLETYFGSCLDSLGVVWGRWDRNVDLPTVEDLNKCSFVIWFTGSNLPTLDGSDRQVLSSYLGGRGRLFITGQDIGYDLCDIISPGYSDESRQFYETYLHARYIRSNSLLFDVLGREGDPISDGLSFAIEGGDGANNQAFPDVIDAIYPASVIFDYSDPDKHAAIRFESDSSKVVYLSFGFEAISSFDARVTLLSRILDWFGGLSGAGNLVDRARFRIYPNPATTYLTIDTSQGLVEKVEIYDVLGRLINRFDLSTLDSSPAFDWDLTDLNGAKVAPGIYFVKLRSSGLLGSSKVILLR